MTTRLHNEELGKRMFKDLIMFCIELQEYRVYRQIVFDIQKLTDYGYKLLISMKLINDFGKQIPHSKMTQHFHDTSYKFCRTFAPHSFPIFFDILV